MTCIRTDASLSIKQTNTHKHYQTNKNPLPGTIEALRENSRLVDFDEGG